MSPRAEPNFGAVFELATQKGAQRLTQANADLQEADTRIAAVRQQLQPLIGATAAQSLVLCGDVRDAILKLQSSLQKLKDAVERMKQGTAAMSEDAVLREIEAKS